MLFAIGMTVVQQQFGHVIVEHALLVVVAVDRGRQAVATDAANATHNAVGSSRIRVDNGDGIAALAQTIANLDSCGAIETRLQIVAYDTEIGQTHPAGFYRTRAGHAMAFALLTHLRLNVLQ